MESIRNELNLEGKTAIGISWKSFKSLTQKKKSVRLRDMEQIFFGLDVVLINLQYGNVDDEINNFCEINYSVKFPIFSKIKVNGPDTHPLFKLLKKDKPGLFRTQSIKWNFTKFLINSNGKIVERFSPRVEPKYIRQEIKKIL